MQTDFNRNERQLNFNSIKGTILEVKNEHIYSSIILEVGHERKRKVYLSIPTEKLDTMKENIPVGTKVDVKFYIASKVKGDRWFTNVNVLAITPDANI